MIRSEDENADQAYHERNGTIKHDGTKPPNGIIRQINPSLDCCCCGRGAGNFEQWHNRDTGYGICADCIKWMRDRKISEAEIKNLYGVEGVNFAKVER